MIFIIGARPYCVDKNKIHARPTKEIFLKGSIIGAIITIPSLVAFFLTWHFFGDKIMALIAGAVVHFIGMGFSLKISKRLFKIKQP